MKYTFQQKQGESSNPEKKNKNYKKYSQDELRESPRPRLTSIQ